MKRTTDKMNFRICMTPDKPVIYVLRGKNGDMLIDTGRKPSVRNIDRWIRKKGFNIKWIFLTHGHFDHTDNARFLQKKYGAEIIIHEKDIAILKGDECPELIPSSDGNRFAAAAANKIVRGITAPECEVNHVLTDNDTDFLRKLGFDADIVMLPGHTYGSMGIMQGKVLYCGDACSAKNGDYRTILFGYDVDLIYESEKKIFALEPLIIAPGHGKLIINEQMFPRKRK